jgi:hypothetical protein
MLQDVRRITQRAGGHSLGRRHFIMFDRTLAESGLDEAMAWQFWLENLPWAGDGQEPTICPCHAFPLHLC